jgi:hypothetical protein
MFEISLLLLHGILMTTYSVHIGEKANVIGVTSSFENHSEGFALAGQAKIDNFTPVAEAVFVR